jgi:hypothetical protein
LPDKPTARPCVGVEGLPGWRATHVSFESGIDEELVMKSAVFALVAVSALCAPLGALCQTDATLTRAQVRAELQQIEQAGYNPAAADDATYPNDIQSAEARLTSGGQTGYGGVPSKSSNSGSRETVRPASPDEMKQLYFGGQ